MKTVMPEIPLMGRKSNRENGCCFGSDFNWTTSLESYVFSLNHFLCFSSNLKWLVNKNIPVPNKS